MHFWRLPLQPILVHECLGVHHPQGWPSHFECTLELTLSCTHCTSIVTLYLWCHCVFRCHLILREVTYLNLCRENQNYDARGVIISGGFWTKGGIIRRYRTKCPSNKPQSFNGMTGRVCLLPVLGLHANGSSSHYPFLTLPPQFHPPLQHTAVYHL